MNRVSGPPSSEPSPRGQRRFLPLTRSSTCDAPGAPVAVKTICATASVWASPLAPNTASLTSMRAVPSGRMRASSSSVPSGMAVRRPRDCSAAVSPSNRDWITATPVGST